MVFFTCNNCGDSLQKPKVEKHIQVECRKKTCNASLTCVDCLADFNRYTYTEHTKCVTEEERYSGKGYVAKASSNKGERKQQSWTEVVNIVLEKPNLPPAQKRLLQTLVHFENVPRKLAKFQNFIRSSCGGRKIDNATIDGVFKLMDAEFKLTKENQNPTNNKPPTENQNEKSEDNVESTPNTLNDTNTVLTNGDNVKNKKKKKYQELEETNTESEKPETQKHKKLKKSDENGVAEPEEQSGVSNGSPNSEEVTEKKHKKRKKSIEVKPESEAQLDSSNEVAEKKQKKHKNSEQTDSVEVNLESEEQLDVANAKALENLSKKERKERKKKLKYEAELKAIQLEGLEPKPDLPAEETVEAETQKKEKKKKRKLAESESSEPAEKKSKLSEPAVVENDENENNLNSSDSFTWDGVIRTLLEKSNNQEMSLKKLCKKTVNEYMVCYQTQKTFEELAKKFNKKITKLPFVKVFKDKAKLTT